jgi:branched-chain amino acid transport system ATP-binding protein
MPDLLTVEGVVAGYGSAKVLHGVDIAVGEGDIAVILGANGAGKTTTLRAITRLLHLWRGLVRVDGKDVSRLSPEEIVRLGVGMVPAGLGVFRDLSVLDNLRVGAFALGHDRRAADRRLDAILGQFPKLDDRKSQRAGTLSGGEQRLLAIARALMGQPRLLLVDEASMGLAPATASSIFDLLYGVRDQGVTLCMVEQSPAALDIADTAFVMSKGKIVDAASGTAISGIRSRAARVYLGSARERAS